MRVDGRPPSRTRMNLEMHGRRPAGRVPGVAVVTDELARTDVGAIRCDEIVEVRVIEQRTRALQLEGVAAEASGLLTDDAADNRDDRCSHGRHDVVALV